MKKLSVILVAFVLLFGTSIAAAEVGLDKEKEFTITKEIGDLLKGGDFTIEEDVNSIVTFMVNEEGEIVVLTVETDDLTIKKFIRSRLNYHKLQNKLTEGGEYKVPIRMKA